MDEINIFFESVAKHKKLVILICIIITFLAIWVFENEIKNHENLRDKLKKEFEEKNNI